MSSLQRTPYDQMIRDAYAGIGRTGFGQSPETIDVPGYQYWQNQLQSGALDPQNFQGVFSGAVQNALQDPNLANTAQYQYINNYLTETPKGPLSSVSPIGPFTGQNPQPYGSLIPSAGPGKEYYTPPYSAPDSLITSSYQPELIGTSPGEPDRPYLPPTKPGFTYPGIPGIDRQDPLYIDDLIGTSPGEPDMPYLPPTKPYPGIPGIDRQDPLYDELIGTSPGEPDRPLPPDMSSLLSQIARPSEAPASRDEVRQLYLDVLGREPDEEGWNYWSDRFGAGISPEERAAFMGIAKPEQVYSPTTITALGDSTTWGYNMGQQVSQGMADTAQSLLSEQLGMPITINNLGVKSTTLGDAMQSGNLQKAINDDSSTVLLNYGMNEAYRGEDPAAFERNLRESVAALRRAGKDVVLQTPNYTEAIPGVNKYADVIRRVAQDARATLHDKWDATQSLYSAYDPRDPVHPTQDIYRYLGQGLAGVLANRYRG